MISEVTKHTILAFLFLGWLFCLLFLDWCAYEVILFQPGRERWFALLVNGGFLISATLVCVIMAKATRRVSKWTVAIVLCFLAALAVTGLWVPLVSSVAGPPWQDRLLGMPHSANTPFMDSVWAWENRDLALKSN